MRNRVRRALQAAIIGRIMRKQAAPAEKPAAVREVDGLIQRVDPVSRELPLLVGKTTMNFYVPLDCNIAMENERVRLRELPPQAQARVTYWVEHGVTIAQSVTVA